MALNKNEKLVVEAIESMLNQDAMLGLSIHKDHQEELGSSERGFEYLHNVIDDMFALKSSELTHTEGVNQAFKKVHNYKYLDDPSFETAMLKEMVAQGIPAKDRDIALGFIPKIISELQEEQADWAEKDSFNPALDEIIEMSQPEQPMDFKIESVEGWDDSGNMEWEEGEASPSKTPSDGETNYPSDA